MHNNMDNCQWWVGKRAPDASQQQTTLAEYKSKILGTFTTNSKRTDNECKIDGTSLGLQWFSSMLITVVCCGMTEAAYGL